MAIIPFGALGSSVRMNSRITMPIRPSNTPRVNDVPRSMFFFWPMRTAMIVQMIQKTMSSMLLPICRRCHPAIDAQ